jgi:hypothetical protein
MLCNNYNFKIFHKDKKMNRLVPWPFSAPHDSFIETYLTTLEPKILNSERILLGKHKSCK